MRSIILALTVALSTAVRCGRSVVEQDLPGNVHGSLFTSNHSAGTLDDSPRLHQDPTIETDVSSAEKLFKQVFSSNIVFRVLDEVASLDVEMSNLGNRIIRILDNDPSKPPSLLDMSNLNISKIIQGVITSGLIELTLSGLLINDTNRDILAADLGRIFVEKTWISMWISDASQGGTLTWDYLYRVVTETKNKANSSETITNSNPREYEKDLTVKARSDSSETEGLASKFFRHFSLQLVALQVTADGALNFAVALNNSAIVAPLCVKLFGSQSLATIISHLSSQVYHLGVLYQYDIGTFHNNVRDLGVIADFFQVSLTHKVYEPQLRKLFYYWYTHGVYKGIQEGLYGPHPGDDHSEKNVMGW